MAEDAIHCGLGASANTVVGDGVVLSAEDAIHCDAVVGEGVVKCMGKCTVNEWKCFYF